MGDKITSVINIVKEVMQNGYGDVKIIIEKHDIVLVEKKEKIKV